jgi:D-alanyl-D-alanine dipeptidase
MTVKIRFQFQIIVAAIISFSTINNCSAQNQQSNKYGLVVIRKINAFNETVSSNSDKQMVDIRKFIPDISFDLRYATANNFMKEKLYPAINTTYIRYAAAKALQQVQLELKKENLGLKIFDAYRPFSVTEKMWEPIKDERYVANPKNGSGHNRGIAVDLTIINLTTKQELPMGTGFDNFSDTAHQTFTALPKEILDNRKLLKNVMEKNGFKALETEWWHYSLPNTKDYEVLDVSFKKLKRLRSNQ